MEICLDKSDIGNNNRLHIIAQMEWLIIGKRSEPIVQNDVKELHKRRNR